MLFLENALKKTFLFSNTSLKTDVKSVSRVTFIFWLTKCYFFIPLNFFLVPLLLLQPCRILQLSYHFHLPSPCLFVVLLPPPRTSQPSREHRSTPSLPSQQGCCSLERQLLFSGLSFLWGFPRLAHCACDLDKVSWGCVRFENEKVIQEILDTNTCSSIHSFQRPSELPFMYPFLP